MFQQNINQSKMYNNLEESLGFVLKLKYFELHLMQI